MKRLILIQNDFAGAGKSTLAQCFRRYLDLHQVTHLATMVTELGASDPEDDAFQLGVEDLHRGALLPLVHASDLVVVEVETGLSEAFAEAYHERGLGRDLDRLGANLVVVVPVTDDEESFDAVTAAARTYGAAVQYLVAHMPTGSDYDGDADGWENSRAARSMDLLDGVDLHLTPAPPALSEELHSIDLDLAEALEHTWCDGDLEKNLRGWFRKVSAQIDVVRPHLFGTAFRPAIAVAARARRGSQPGSRTRTRSGETAMLA